MAEALVPGFSLAPLAQFDPVSEPISLGPRWKVWKRRFETYVAALNITDGQRKRALLLYQVGEATQAIFDTLPETGDDYDTAMRKLDDYFTPKKNVDFETFKFRTATQQEGENVDQYTTRLRKLAQNCEFTDIDRELKSTIIQNCSSKRLRRIALRDDLTLTVLLAKARSMEASEIQASGMEQLSVSVNKLQLRNPRQSSTDKQVPTISPKQCNRCGFPWPHKDGPCPAMGKSCKNCGKLNHFARVCLSKTKPQNEGQYKSNSKIIRRVITEYLPRQDYESPASSSDDEYLYVLGTPSPNKAPMVTVKVNTIPVRMMIDTGASADIMDETSFNEICECCKINLKPPTKRIFAYGSDSQLVVLGQFTARIGIASLSVESTIHVLQRGNGSLLSCKTAQALNLVAITLNQISPKCHVSDELIVKFPKLFTGIGKLKNEQVQLHIDTSVMPVAQPARRIPFHLRKQVAEELDNLERQNIIEKVEDATPWVSPLAIAPKKNGR